MNNGTSGDRSHSIRSNGDKTRYILILWVTHSRVLYIYTLSSLDFTVQPSNKKVFAGIDVLFQCSHSSADNIGWRLNGTSINTPNFTKECHYYREVRYLNDSTKLNIFKIRAAPGCNDTTVQCVAFFFNNTAPEISTEATLIVQG